MMTEKLAKTAQAANESVSSTIAATEATHTEVKANMEKTMKTAQEMAAFGQGNLEAFVKSGQIWAAGVQDLNKSLVASAQAQFEQAVEAVTSFVAVKSFNELLDLQAAVTRGSLDKAITETAKLTDASTKLATDALAPIAARVTLAAETFRRAA